MNAQSDSFKTEFNKLVDALKANDEKHHQLTNFLGMVESKMNNAEKGIESKSNERDALQSRVEKRIAEVASYHAIDTEKLVSSKNFFVRNSFISNSFYSHRS